MASITASATIPLPHKFQVGRGQGVGPGWIEQQPAGSPRRGLDLAGLSGLAGSLACWAPSLPLQNRRLLPAGVVRRLAQEGGCIEARP